MFERKFVVYCHFHLGWRGTVFEREWFEGCALRMAKRRPICFKLHSGSTGGLWMDGWIDLLVGTGVSTALWLREFDHFMEPWHQKFFVLLWDQSVTLKEGQREKNMQFSSCFNILLKVCHCRCLACVPLGWASKVRTLKLYVIRAELEKMNLIFSSKSICITPC